MNKFALDMRYIANEARSEAIFNRILNAARNGEYSIIETNLSPGNIQWLRDDLGYTVTKSPSYRNAHEVRW